MEKKRIDYLDMVKGIGIILVVVGHSTFAGDNLLTWLTSFHMPLFFIVSGMLIQHIGEEKKEMRTILKRKAKSILLPYVTFSVIFIVVKVLYLIRMPELITSLDIQKAIVQSFSFYGISVLWFLPALFVGELLFIGVRKKCNHVFTVSIGIILMIAAVFGKPILDAHVAMDSSLMLLYVGGFAKMLLRSCVAYVFLMLGYYTKVFLKESDKTKWAEIAVGIALLLFNIYSSYKNGRVDLNFLVFGNPIAYLFNAYIGTMALVLICKNSRTIKPLVYFGVNSLIIMATHLECQILMIAIKIANKAVAISPFAKSLVLYSVLAISLVIMEIITIYIFNHYLYFLIGKKKAKPLVLPKKKSQRADGSKSEGK